MQRWRLSAQASALLLSWQCRRASSSLQFGSRRYRRLRAIILATEPLCRTCKAAGRYISATEVDHIAPRHKGGEVADVANLQPLCAECHAAKTDKEGSRLTQKRRFAACEHGTPAGLTCRLCR